MCFTITVKKIEFTLTVFSITVKKIETVRKFGLSSSVDTLVVIESLVIVGGPNDVVSG